LNTEVTILELFGGFCRLKGSKDGIPLLSVIALGPLVDFKESKVGGLFQESRIEAETVFERKRSLVQT